MLDENPIYRPEEGEIIDDGIIWDTYMYEDVIAQIPKENKEGRTEYARAINEILEEDVPAPDIQQATIEGQQYGLVFERVHGESLKTTQENIKELKQQGKDHSSLRETYLEAVENAGTALARIHLNDAEGYGTPDYENQNYRQGSFSDWKSFVEHKIEDTKEFAGGGIFDKAIELGAQNLELETVPSYPDSKVLHNDFSSDNIILEEDGSIQVIDFDNAIYGDRRFGRIRSQGNLCKGDSEAHQSFNKGYESIADTEISEELKDSYTALSILFSAKAGEWVDRNREQDVEQWAEGVNSWAEEYFS